MLTRAAPGGLGLIGMAVVVCALYYTGAGNWMMLRLQGLSENCHAAVPSIAAPVGYPVCTGVVRGVNEIDKVATYVGQILGRIPKMFDFSGSSHDLMAGISDSVGQSLAGITSSSESLNAMIRNGPSALTGSNVSQQFQQAVDSFAIGQHYMRSGGDAKQALPWLQQGARQPSGFGLLSQLSLGDLYRRGGAGIPADPARSNAYYRMASDSLGKLNASGTPQAQRLLQTLPTSPQAMQRNINQAIAGMQR
jgi:hypothetical protein